MQRFFSNLEHGDNRVIDSRLKFKNVKNKLQSSVTYIIVIKQ